MPRRAARCSGARRAEDLVVTANPAADHGPAASIATTDPSARRHRHLPTPTIKPVTDDEPGVSTHGGTTDDQRRPGCTNNGPCRGRRGAGPRRSLVAGDPLL